MRQICGVTACLVSQVVVCCSSAVPPLEETLCMRPQRQPTSGRRRSENRSALRNDLKHDGGAPLTPGAPLWGIRRRTKGALHRPRSRRQRSPVRRFFPTHSRTSSFSQKGPRSICNFFSVCSARSRCSFKFRKSSAGSIPLRIQGLRRFKRERKGNIVKLRHKLRSR